MSICYFIATVSFLEQLFFSSTAYQTDFRNGAKYIYMERNIMIVT